jgi:hypothetical protein
LSIHFLDVVKVSYKIVNKKVSIHIYKNDKSLGIIYDNLSLPLYPTIGLYSENDEIEIINSNE